MDQYYVRIWDKTGTRVYGWLGEQDRWAACVPAGVYSNPISTPGAAIVGWEPDPSNSKVGKLTITDENGELWLGGTGTNGVSAFWQYAKYKDDCYWLTLKSDPSLPLDSPVRGTMSGALVHFNGSKPFPLHAWYTINNNVFGLNYLETEESRGELFSSGEVYLEFETSALVFEFVPVSAFDATKDSYAPGLKSKYDNWGKYDTPTWMGDLTNVIADRPLADLVVPGSHDAACWEIRSPGTNQRSQTQSREIYDQLRAGSRYLDLRFYKVGPGQWRGFHGYDSAEAMLGPVLADIMRFLAGSPMEIIAVSLLPWHKDVPDEFWDIVINSLNDWAFPTRFVEMVNGVPTKSNNHIAEATQRKILGQGKKIVLFSWGEPPTGTVADGPMKGRERADFIWAATPEKPVPTHGAEPWKNAFAAAQAQGYAIDFDLAGVWLDSGDTTANDIRLMLGAVQPPSGGPLWMMHTNAPATPGGEWISTKAARIQPPLVRFVREDPVMAAKLNFVNLDFVGDDQSIVLALIEANLFR
ncbi:hypothetical protein [Sphingomonas asaccharolytica]|uniref:hypothetical protein n=1 Tax=Sphingomonas asaccharolytica TaxID=40681 RepID=UPI0008370AB7|nr:hypothetical protein [Sphingomonas asaccharolytica]